MHRPTTSPRSPFADSRLKLRVLRIALGLALAAPAVIAVIARLR